jgi:hypothetical protein
MPPTPKDPSFGNARRSSPEHVVDSAGGRKYSQLCFWKSKHSRLTCHKDVTRERQFQSASQRGTAERNDDGLGDGTPGERHFLNMPYR